MRIGHLLINVCLKLFCKHIQNEQHGGLLCPSSTLTETFRGTDSDWVPVIKVISTSVVSLAQNKKLRLKLTVLALCVSVKVFLTVYCLITKWREGKACTLGWGWRFYIQQSCQTDNWSLSHTVKEESTINFHHSWVVKPGVFWGAVQPNQSITTVLCQKRNIIIQLKQKQSCKVVCDVHITSLSFHDLTIAVCFLSCQHSWWRETGRRLDPLTIRGRGEWSERRVTCDISQLCILVSNPQSSRLLRTVSVWKLAPLSACHCMSQHLLYSWLQDACSQSFSSPPLFSLFFHIPATTISPHPSSPTQLTPSDSSDVSLP